MLEQGFSREISRKLLLVVEYLRLMLQQFKEPLVEKSESHQLLVELYLAELLAWVPPIKYSRVGQEVIVT